MRYIKWNRMADEHLHLHSEIMLVVFRHHVTILFIANSMSVARLLMYHNVHECCNLYPMPAQLQGQVSETVQ